MSLCGVTTLYCVRDRTMGISDTPDCSSVENSFVWYFPTRHAVRILMCMCVFICVCACVFLSSRQASDIMYKVTLLSHKGVFCFLRFSDASRRCTSFSRVDIYVSLPLDATACQTDCSWQDFISRHVSLHPNLL
jgi:hypothetical protein